MSDLRFLLAWLLPAMALANVLRQPAAAGMWTVLVWALVAGVDAWVPRADRSPPACDSKADAVWARAVLRLYVPLHLALLCVALWVAGREASPQWMGLAFAVGFVTGAQGITFAHELGHSRSRLDRVLAWVLMASVAYPQFMVEHYRGHHVRAATRGDPATARRGESLWRFLPRTLVGSLLSAWRLERARWRQMDVSPWRSPVVWATVAPCAIIVLLVALGAWGALLVWLLQAMFAIWLLETVNYIEHYGLQRKPTTDGRVEPFGVGHAWNADHVLTNSLLANLQRHSDHHMHAWKPFEQLQALPGPQLPTGYAGCLLLAAVPPLWFRVMHPRLDTLERQGLG